MLMPPGHHYSREQLEHLKRSEIQKLCKDYGLRANMKTETLVDELLETIRSNIAPLVPPPQAPQQSGPVTRRASTRSRTSSRSTTIRTRGSSGSSFTASEATDTLVGTDGALSGTDSFGSQNATGSRVRKAKDSQYKLGVGRPAAAGGSGARSFTRSTSKNRRNRMSRSVKPVEETIEEEQEAEQSVATGSAAPADPALLYPQITPAEPTQAIQTPPAIHYPDGEVLSRLANIESHIQNLEIPQHLDMLRTVANEFAWLKQVVQNQHMEINNMKADIQSCRLENQALRNDSNKVLFLENQVSALKESVAYVRATFANSAPGTPGLKGGLQRRVSIPLGDSNINAATPQRPVASSNPSDENLAPMVAFTPASNPVTPPPSRPTPVPPSTLGKRPRDSASSELADALEENTDGGEDLARRVLRPNKKKAKISKSDDSVALPSSDGNCDANVNDNASTASGPSTVPPIGTPPPSSHLPDYFADTVDGAQQTVGDDDAAGNKAGTFGPDGFYPFTFGAGAASSTPRGDAYSAFGADFSLGSAVKTPAQRGPSGTGLAPQAFSMRRVSSLAARPRTPARLTGQERFKSTTANNSASANNNNNSVAQQQQQQQQQQVQQQQTVDFPHADSFGFQIDDDAYGLDFQANREAAAMHPNPMSMNLHFGIGFGIPPDDGGSSPVQNMQKTMYGTELANDTRFGDFGRDGVASTSGRNMFWWG